MTRTAHDQLPGEGIGTVPRLPIHRTLEIGIIDGGPVFVEVEIRPTPKGPELSICGTYPGGGGQCDDTIATMTEFAPGWSAKLRDRLVAVWRAWYLNGTRAGCAHQRAAGWQSCPGYHRPGESCPDPVGLPFPYTPGDAYAHEPRRHCHNDAISMPCPVCGYRYGSAWLYEPLPPEILAEVLAWPTGGIEPGSDGQAPNPYDLQAARWLKRYGVRFSADHTQSKAGVGTAAQHWTVTLRASKLRPFTFDFWNSQHDTEKGIPLRAYSVLACLASDSTMTDADEIAADLGMAPSEACKAAAWGQRIARWLAQVEAQVPGATEALMRIQ